VKKKDYPLKMLKWFYHLFWLINMLLVITVYLMDAYSSGKTASLFGFYLVLAAVPILSFWEIFLFLLLPNALMVGVWGFNILTLKEAIYTIFIYEALALVISQATYQTFLRMLDNEIKLHQSAKKLELMSLQDPLTGLNNRFGLTRAFNELKAGAKHNDLLFVIAIDIDFFKRFNDQHGHLVGDECLVHLANNIRTVFCDNNSAVGRIGGDEFIILYKTTFFKEVEWKMEMMYASLDELSQLLPLEETPISLSSGIAFAELKQLTTWTYLYEDADSLLYKIKNSGRNQFLFATKKEAE